MRVLLKWLGIIPLILSYSFISSASGLLPLHQKTTRGIGMRVSSFFSRLILRVLGVRVSVNHRERLLNENGACLIISNHLSYIDVLVLCSLVPAVFVTSVELKHTAIIGLLARLSNSLFVERRSPAGLKREIEDIALVLGQGFPVVLFPEGTTSNGDRVHQFKHSLFDAAIATRSRILPICLRYTKINDRILTPHNRDKVFYYGGVTFFRHLPRLLSLSSIDVEVVPLAAITVQPNHTRKDLSTLAQSVISAAYTS